MRFEETKLNGAYLLTLDLIEDGRGFFARSFCQKEFEHHGLNSAIVQCNIAYNKKKGTLRGLHYQIEPYAETKVVFCRKGAIWDVIVDLRRDSSTFRQWQGFKLSDENHQALYIPQGFAHGCQTLEDDTELFYLMGEAFHPELAKGLYWNDPDLGIDWPIHPPILSSKDRGLPKLKDLYP
jgi:dTDP-4-dehydrorhamnose 3,5-epimerase